MRLRLREAIHTALRSPSAAHLNDTDHLLRIVTIAKAELARTCATSSAAPELGRWLGVSASAIHQSLKRQRAASTLVTRQRFREAGTVRGLFIGVPEHIEAFRAGDRQHPLALDRPALATLLRLVERLFAPGWHHRDGRVTPPGLLAARTGRGAPTDRLALLLLVLEARPDGRVRLCSGRVCKRGRAAATLARLLGNGCTPAGAAGILQRLQSAEAIQLVRRETSSRLHQRGGIVVPTVAQDWTTMKAARQRSAASRSDTAAPATRPRRRCVGTPRRWRSQGPQVVPSSQRTPLLKPFTPRTPVTVALMVRLMSRLVFPAKPRQGFPPLPVGRVRTRGSPTRSGRVSAARHPARR